MVTALLLIALSSPAHAWSVKTSSAGDPLRWMTFPVSFVVNPSNSQGLDEDAVLNVVRTAAEQWTGEMDLPLAFDFGGPSGMATADYQDSANAVYFEDNWPSDWDSGFLALTFTWSVDGGEIIAFDMAINEQFDWTLKPDEQSHDLANALTHEFGHVVGMGHSEVFEATMYADSQVGDTKKQDLAQDDLDGLRYLYTGIEMQPEWACATGNVQPISFVGLFGLAGAIGLRRRRARP